MKRDDGGSQPGRWLQGKTVIHYFDGDAAACNKLLKPGAEPLEGDERKYCGLCRKRLFLRKSKTERSVFVSERAKSKRLEKLPTIIDAERKK